MKTRSRPSECIHTLTPIERREDPASTLDEHDPVKLFLNDPHPKSQATAMVADNTADKTAQSSGEPPPSEAPLLNGYTSSYSTDLRLGQALLNGNLNDTVQLATTSSTTLHTDGVGFLTARDLYQFRGLDEDATRDSMLGRCDSPPGESLLPDPLDNTTQMSLCQRSEKLQLHDLQGNLTGEEGKGLLWGIVKTEAQPGTPEVESEGKPVVPDSSQAQSDGKLLVLSEADSTVGTDLLYDNTVAVTSGQFVFSKFGSDVPGVLTFNSMSSKDSSTFTSDSVTLRPSAVALDNDVTGKTTLLDPALQQATESQHSIQPPLPAPLRRTINEPPLTQTFPARSAGAELKILVQPEGQHRARYMTEGSRGAIKDRTQQAHPVIQLLGYKKSAVLQVFIGTDTGKVRPHGFYQACKVFGKNSTQCTEREIDGTVVIEIQLEPDDDMKASIDCVGILKLRNADVEQRIGITHSKKKSTRARLVFRVAIPKNDGTYQTLQVASSLISCTQPAGQPEICKQSLRECEVSGGRELYIIGKNFMRGTKVVFEEKQDEQTIWSAEAVIDAEYFNNAHLICSVPAYRDQSIREKVDVEVVIHSSGRVSHPQPFIYTPVCTSVQHVHKQDVDMETDEASALARKAFVSPIALALNKMYEKQAAQSNQDQDSDGSKMLKTESVDVKPPDFTVPNVFPVRAGSGGQCIARGIQNQSAGAAAVDGVSGFQQASTLQQPGEYQQESRDERSDSPHVSKKAKYVSSGIPEMEIEQSHTVHHHPTPQLEPNQPLFSTNSNGQGQSASFEMVQQTAPLQTRDLFSQGGQMQQSHTIHHHPQPSPGNLSAGLHTPTGRHTYTAPDLALQQQASTPSFQAPANHQPLHQHAQQNNAFSTQRSMEFDSQGTTSPSAPNYVSPMERSGQSEKDQNFTPSTPTNLIEGQKSPLEQQSIFHAPQAQPSASSNEPIHNVFDPSKEMSPNLNPQQSFSQFLQPAYQGQVDDAGTGQQQANQFGTLAGVESSPQLNYNAFPGLGGSAGQAVESKPGSGEHTPCHYIPATPGNPRPEDPVPGYTGNTDPHSLQSPTSREGSGELSQVPQLREALLELQSLRKMQEEVEEPCAMDMQTSSAVGTSIHGSPAAPLPQDGDDKRSSFEPDQSCAPPSELLQLLKMTEPSDQTTLPVLSQHQASGSPFINTPTSPIIGQQSVTSPNYSTHRHRSSFEQNIVSQQPSPQQPSELEELKMLQKQLESPAATDPNQIQLPLSQNQEEILQQQHQAFQQQQAEQEKLLHEQHNAFQHVTAWQSNNAQLQSEQSPVFHPSTVQTRQDGLGDCLDAVQQPQQALPGSSINSQDQVLHQQNAFQHPSTEMNPNNIQNRHEATQHQSFQQQQNFQEKLLPNKEQLFHQQSAELQPHGSMHSHNLENQDAGQISSSHVLQQQQSTVQSPVQYKQLEEKLHDSYKQQASVETSGAAQQQNACQESPFQTFAINQLKEGHPPQQQPTFSQGTLQHPTSPLTGYQPGHGQTAAEIGASQCNEDKGPQQQKQLTAHSQDNSELVQRLLATAVNANVPDQQVLTNEERLKRERDLLVSLLQQNSIILQPPNGQPTARHQDSTSPLNTLVQPNQTEQRFVPGYSSITNQPQAIFQATSRSMANIGSTNMTSGQSSVSPSNVAASSQGPPQLGAVQPVFVLQQHTAPVPSPAVVPHSSSTQTLEKPQSNKPLTVQELLTLNQRPILPAPPKNPQTSHPLTVILTQTATPKQVVLPNNNANITDPTQTNVQTVKIDNVPTLSGPSQSDTLNSLLQTSSSQPTAATFPQASPQLVVQPVGLQSTPSMLYVLRKPDGTLKIESGSSLFGPAMSQGTSALTTSSGVAASIIGQLQVRDPGAHSQPAATPQPMELESSLQQVTSQQSILASVLQGGSVNPQAPPTSNSDFTTAQDAGPVRSPSFKSGDVLSPAAAPSNPMLPNPNNTTTPMEVAPAVSQADWSSTQANGRNLPRLAAEDVDRLLNPDPATSS